MGLVEESIGSGADSSQEPIVIGPAPPLTAVEAKTLQRLKDKVREPGGGIELRDASGRSSGCWPWG